MKHVEWLRRGMQAGSAFHVKKKIPWRHNTINILALCFWWVLFFAFMALAAVLPVWAYLPIAALGFGTLMFGWAILVIHECSHDMFIATRSPKRTRWWNNRIGRLASAFMFTAYVEHWEKGHRIHHLEPCEEADPQDRHPLTGKALYREYLKLALIPGVFIAMNPSAKYPGGLKRTLHGVALWTPLFVYGVKFISPWIPLAFFLSFHVTMALNLTKKAQEHGAGLAHEPDFFLRSRTYFYPLWQLFSPYCINYHFEHHLNFKVPWYSLPAYHEALRELMPRELQPYFFHNEFMAQLAGTKPLPPDELRHLMEPASSERSPVSPAELGSVDTSGLGRATV